MFSLFEVIALQMQTMLEELAVKADEQMNSTCSGKKLTHTEGERVRHFIGRMRKVGEEVIIKTNQ